MSERVDNLVGELMRLYAKFSADEFGEAVHRIENRDFNQLKPLIRTTWSAHPGSSVRLSSSAHMKKKATSRELFDLDIVKFRHTRGAKYQEIADFLESLGNRQILAKPMDVRKFAMEMNLEPLPHKFDRFAIARKIAKRLRELSNEEVEDLLARAHASGESGSSLQRWAGVIVKG